MSNLLWPGDQTVRGAGGAMEIAIWAAHIGAKKGERPFGCVVTDPTGRVLAVSYGSIDPLDHSEMLAIREACRVLGQSSLEECTLVSTHQPCHMCCGAIKHAHLSTVVWGSRRSSLPGLFRAYDVSSAAVLRDSGHPPRFVVTDMMRKECEALFDEELKIAREAQEAVNEQQR